jgi:hypothetical protein
MITTLGWSGAKFAKVNIGKNKVNRLAIGISATQRQDIICGKNFIRLESWWLYPLFSRFFRLIDKQTDFSIATFSTPILAMTFAPWTRRSLIGGSQGSEIALTLVTTLIPPVRVRLFLFECLDLLCSFL